MTRGCCFPKCRNKSGRGCPYTFHRIPLYDIPLRQRWLATLQREITTPPDATKHLRVCSYHFSEDDYERSWSDKSQRPKLKYTAVPTYPAAPPVLRSWQNSDLINPLLKTRGDDMHATEEQLQDGGKLKEEGRASGKIECSMPDVKRRDVNKEKDIKEEMDIKEEEVDSVYIIEYTNAEEEGNSYQVTMKVDHSLLDKSLDAKPRPENFKANIKGTKAASERKRPSASAAHVTEVRRSFFCATCQQATLSQAELDWHTRRHANQAAVYTCPLCRGAPAYAGNRWGLMRHLQREHRGVVPDCGICGRGFRSLEWYLADQFRHVGTTPYFCARCKVYEMTEQGLNIHMENHHKESEMSAVLSQ